MRIWFALMASMRSTEMRRMKKRCSISTIARALAFALPDLVSRLEQCTRLSLEPLDEDARRRVLRQRAERRGLELDDAVLDYLFRRVGRDLATLTGLLDRLDRESLAAQRRITVPFLKQFLPSP